MLLFVRVELDWSRVIHRQLSAGRGELGLMHVLYWSGNPCAADQDEFRHFGTAKQETRLAFPCWHTLAAGSHGATVPLLVEAVLAVPCAAAAAAAAAAYCAC
jgi:hypothetical protein